MRATLERHRRRRIEQGDATGFTLIELLITVVILGVLAAIVVFAVQDLTTSGVRSSCSADFSTVKEAVEAYKAEEGSYPDAGVPTFAMARAKNGVYALMQRDDGSQNGKGSPTKVIGPWLKDIPYNPTHYEITVSADGKGTVTVILNPGLPQPVDTLASLGSVVPGSSACSDV